MKKGILFLGVLFWFITGMANQDSSYVLVKEFQVEKARIQGSINKLNKSSQDLHGEFQKQSASLDSLIQLLVLQKEAMTANRDSLHQLKISQYDLDGRLLTQRKSGTLIAILIPAGLFLLFLFLLIWFLNFRRWTRSRLQQIEDQQNQQTRRMDDLQATFQKSTEAVKEELRATGKELETRVQKAITDMLQKLDHTEQVIREEHASHDARHDELTREYELFKENLLQNYETLTKDLIRLKEQLVAHATDFTASLKELAKRITE